MITESLHGPRRVRPATTDDASFWWDGLERRELRIQRCGACARLRHPFQVRCPGCGDLGWDWLVASGSGSLHSFVVYHEPILSETLYPYTVGLVDLAEGTRVIAPMLPNDGSGLEVGAPVRLVWYDDHDGPVWPVFVPTGGAR
ncbi:MAG: OB-fold domain-containing protein [Nocardioidaceae bacterium]|nr:OB-fold domain-containing protein [Nocardioidaceae bacterium]